VQAIAGRHPDVAAILLEPIQGESGVHPLPVAHLQALRRLCDEHGWLLMFDEVQCGNGRTGSHFYFQQAGVTPDVLTTAKALGNGVPIGACLARGSAAITFAPGHHGSTYGGNPLACAAAGAVLDALEDSALMARVEPLGAAIRHSFLETLRHGDVLREIRGVGLMIGIELDRDCGPLAAMALEAGLLINVTAGNTLRLLPPLVLSDGQAQQLGSTLARVVDRWLDGENA
jgi:acetylornithine aminotransferase